MPDTGIAQLSAAELGRAYAAGKLSPVEVAKDHLARIEAFEPQVNAFVHRDAETTLAMARASEARWQAKTPLSPLDGVPLTIKDNLAVAGWPNRRGSAVSSAAPEAQDCPVADKLRAAGTVFLGKTTMPEYGWKGCADSPLTGMTRNPWDSRPRRVARPPVRQSARRSISVASISARMARARSAFLPPSRVFSASRPVSVACRHFPSRPWACWRISGR